MIKPADLPDVLPVFPLSGALLLPRSRLPLHIFEPRYLTMFEDVLKTPHRMIGMVQPKDFEDEEAPELHKVGCAGRVTQFTETDDGRYMITLSGISRYRIVTEVDGFTPYRRCQISWDGFERDLGGAEHDTDFKRDAFLKLLSRYFASLKLDTDWETLKDAEDELLLNSLSMLLEFAPEDRQALLEAPSLKVRREILMTLMEFSLHGGDNEDFLQ